MKKIFTIFAAALMCVTAYAQCPSTLLFQLSERNDNGEIVAAEQVSANKVLIELKLVNSSAFLNGFNIEVQKPDEAEWILDEEEYDWVGFRGYGHTILAMASGTHNDAWYENNLFKKADLKCNIKYQGLILFEILNTNDCRFFPILEEPTSVARFSIDMSGCADGNYIIKANNAQVNIDNSYDVNNDNMVNCYDATLLYEWLLGNLQPMPTDNWDLDNDGSLSRADLTVLYSYFLNDYNANTGYSFSYLGGDAAAGEPNGAIMPDEPVILELTKTGDVVTLKSTSEPIEYSEFYAVGTFNGWSQEDGMVQLEGNEEGTQYTGEVQLENGAEFKVITPVDGGWKWFGGVDENQVGYFEINDGVLNQPIELIDGANFKVVGDGKYTITVMQPTTADGKGIAEPLVMTVSKEATGISTIAADKADNRIFDLQGRELKSVPEHGIYIQNGKKYVK